MKKITLIIGLYLLILPAFAQNWQTVKIDSAVSFKLPKGFQKNNSDNKNSFSASTAFGTILVFKTPDNPKVIPDIEKDRHLIRYYNDYIKRISSSSEDGKITGEKDTLIGDMKVKDFTLEIDTGSGSQYRNFRILHANAATYTFEFLYHDIHTEYALPEKEQFFNSITVNENLDRESQFTEDTNVPQSKNNLYIITGAATLIVFLLIITLQSRRKKRR